MIPGDVLSYLKSVLVRRRSMSDTFVTVMMLKCYAAFMILGSGVLWSWFAYARYCFTKDIRTWAWLGFILVGLFLSLYFINGWQPLK